MAGEQRLEHGFVERPAGERRKNLHAGGAELVDGALGLLDRTHDVGERQRGDEAGKAVGMLLAKLRHGVVGDARQRQALAGRGEILDRRIGQRDHLPVVAELVHFLEPRIEVVDLAHAAQPGRDIAELWRDLVHLVEKAGGRDVAVEGR